MYDVIVVGARCAGSPTAMLLARKGYRVLLLDRTTFPSDSPTSTRLVHPPGVLRLRRWGVLEDLKASGCPPIHRYGLRSGPVNLMASLPSVDGVSTAYSPDREVLDYLLVNAAVKAGTELREGVSVQNLLTDDAGTVVGVQGTSKSGGMLEERASMVVGADGVHSRVARIVEAPVYNTRGLLSKSWWTYWSGVSLNNEVVTFRENHKHAFAWPTHDDLVIVGVAWPPDEFKELEKDAESAFFGALDEVAPDFARQIRAGKREGRWMCGSVPNFFRKPYGPGWALVGDASYSKDPGTAAGITDAMSGAELLAEALDEGLSGRRPAQEALWDYESKRNDKAFPHYDYTCDFATLRIYDRDELEMLSAMASSPEHASALLAMFADMMSPADFFSASRVHELFDHMNTRNTSRGLRFVRWLLKGTPGRFEYSRKLADRLIAKNLGEMGKYFLAESQGRQVPIAPGA